MLNSVTALAGVVFGAAIAISFKTVLVTVVVVKTLEWLYS